MDLTGDNIIVSSLYIYYRITIIIIIQFILIKYITKYIITRGNGNEGGGNKIILQVIIRIRHHERGYIIRFLYI